MPQELAPCPNPKGRAKKTALQENVVPCRWVRLNSALLQRGIKDDHFQNSQLEEHWDPKRSPAHLAGNGKCQTEHKSQTTDIHETR